MLVFDLGTYSCLAVVFIYSVLNTAISFLLCVDSDFPASSRAAGPMQRAADAWPLANNIKFWSYSEIQLDGQGNLVKLIILSFGATVLDQLVECAET